MKMVKSLLLGSAAGLVAVAGAQAADLPVKAKPVEYVKVCSLYGAGFYYMPGTDICMKIGGHVRYQVYAGVANDLTKGGMTAAWGTRVTDVDVGIRTRAWVTHDTRQQTAYGTLRTYFLIGFNQDNGGSALATAAAGGGGTFLYVNRGFIQIAGFTFGRAQSYFDIYPNASFSYLAGANYVADTGDSGVQMAAYTAQFGNGMSATISVEQSRRNATINGGITGTAQITLPIGGIAGASSSQGVSPAAGGTAYPDIVANFRVDQTWGSILLGGVLHDASGQYYSATGTAASVTVGAGHPGNVWGYGFTAGFILNLPMIAPGDRLSAQYAYTVGATKYASQTPGSLLKRSGQTIGVGFMTDGIYGLPGSSVELTSAWSITGAFEHLWTPALRTSLYGSYISYSYNTNAKALFCASNDFGTGTAAAGCDPNWSAWNIGTRTQWEPVRGLSMGVDLMYMRLNSMKTATGTSTLGAAIGGLPAGTVLAVADQSQVAASFRIQRDFLP